ncbi:MAG: hypothetical protein AAGG75_07650 [Bacteroidota bacterium]
MLKKLLLLLLPALFLSNCGKDEVFLFEVPYEIQFTIPAGLNPFETHIFETTMIATRLDSLLVFNGLPWEEVESIKPRSASINTIFANSSYDFIRETSIEVFDANDPVRVWREVFYREEVPFNTGNRLDYLASLEDVKDFMDDGVFNIRVRLLLREIPPEFIETRLQFNLGVK